MKQNINQKLSKNKELTNTNVAISTQKETSLLPNDNAQKNKDQQQEQARYLNRILEAYGDCV